MAEPTAPAGGQHAGCPTCGGKGYGLDHDRRCPGGGDICDRLCPVPVLCVDCHDLCLGCDLIVQERHRQIADEGWTPEHDDEHADFALTQAAIGYAAEAVEPLAPRYSMPVTWPWHPSWWKPSDDPIRNLVKAGALIAAEIDRLTRAARRSDDG